MNSREFRTQAYRHYRTWRDQAPAMPVPLPNRPNVWLVTRFDEVVQLLKDDRFSKKRTHDGNALPNWLMPSFVSALAENMLDTDPPDHTRLRNLVHKAFTPRMIEQMRGRVAQVADELLDSAERRGSFDIIADYALPIPLTIISEMLGVPQEDHNKFHRWTTALTSLQSNQFEFKLLPAIFGFTNYLRKLCRQRRQEPGDDLITALVQAQQEGDRLSENELIAMGILLLVAGHETTVNLIGNGALALLENPDQMEKLRRHPEHMKTAIEEFLRYYSPVEVTTDRFTTADTEFGGVMIPKGSVVLGVLASANRDERRFTDADVLDITRDPNPHLAFGQGIHYCLGAPLARLEGQIAFAKLLERMPHLRLSVPREAVVWRSSFLVRGLEALPVSTGVRV
jgi:cytochrome P450 PksS